jgi:hypothetical protein
VLKAETVYVNTVDGSEEVKLGDHLFQFGGQGDGYCYGHQTFDCLENLTDEENEALRHG